jgi:hypothetical protein
MATKTTQQARLVVLSLGVVLSISSDAMATLSEGSEFAAAKRLQLLQETIRTGTVSVRGPVLDQNEPQQTFCNGGQRVNGDKCS